MSTKCYISLRSVVSTRYRCIGAYRTEEGKPYYFKVVRKAEEIILADPTVNKEYLPISGLKTFCDASQKFILGDNSAAIKENRVCTVQGLSGTGSLAIGASFLHTYHPNSQVYLSNITWENHQAIFQFAGYPQEQFKTYRYYDAKTVGLDFEGYTEDLKKAPELSIIVFHTCAHNPTGVDPTQEQWNVLFNICKTNNLIPFFDTAYQGFASGDLVKDAYPVRLFVDGGMEVFASQSYAKNMGLYSERIGALNVITKSEHAAAALKGELMRITRSFCSNCPSHGARIVSMILTNPQMFQDWVSELKEVVARILKMRKMLQDELEAIKTPGKWDHITKQIGMFSYTGLDAEQSERMVKKHHVYMAKSGRISVPGLRESNVKYMAKCIKEVVEWKINGKKD